MYMTVPCDIGGVNELPSRQTGSVGWSGYHRPDCACRGVRLAGPERETLELAAAGAAQVLGPDHGVTKALAKASITEAVPATSARAGAASRHRAMVRARMDLACHILPFRPGAVVRGAD